MISPSVYSQAYGEFRKNQHEVIELLRASPNDVNQLASPVHRQLANALHRGSVVLLSSHLERYIETLVVESIDAINLARLPATSLPESLLLKSIEPALSTAHEATKRSKKASLLKELAGDYTWFWDDVTPCKLSSAALVDDFSNPLPTRINRLFLVFNIDNVVGKAVGLSKDPGRAIVEAKVRELVEKRNSVAHTGMTFDVTRQDVIMYFRCTYRLVRGIDIVVGNSIQSLTRTWPWQGKQDIA